MKCKYLMKKKCYFLSKQYNIFTTDYLLEQDTYICADSTWRSMWQTNCKESVWTILENCPASISCFFLWQDSIVPLSIRNL
jgi:hypothetical protein